MVLGGGVVGENAARVAAGLGARVSVFDRSLARLRELDRMFAGRISTCYASALAIEECLPQVDLAIGAVLVKGARAPCVLTRRHLGLMKKGAVLVDVSIDQGGCFETSTPTTHSNPIVTVDGIPHYCVANMPGAVPVTSTRALTNATLSYVLSLVDEGPTGALERDPGLRAGVNVAAGAIANQAVAEALGCEWVDPLTALNTGASVQRLDTTSAVG